MAIAFPHPSRKHQSQPHSRQYSRSIRRQRSHTRGTQPVLRRNAQARIRSSLLRRKEARRRCELDVSGERSEFCGHGSGPARSGTGVGRGNVGLGVGECGRGEGEGYGVGEFLV